MCDERSVMSVVLERVKVIVTEVVMVIGGE